MPKNAITLFTPIAFFGIMPAVNQWRNRLIWILVGIGIGLCIFRYLSNPSLSDDEAAVAFNLVHRSVPRLFKPLDDNQAAPVLFLMLEKFAQVTFGPGEFALRLFPLLCSIASLLLFPKFAKRCLDSSASFIAVVLFSLSIPLIYYSSQVKPYSEDVLVTICLYLSAFHFQSKSSSTRGAVFYALVGGVAIWFSIPAPMVLAGVGSSLSVLFVVKREWQSVRKLCLAASAWVFSFVLNYRLVLRYPASNTALLSAWNEGFVRLPTTTSGAKRLIHILTDLFHYGPASVHGYRIGALLFIGCCYLLFFAGSISLWKRRRFVLMLLLSPIPFTLLASFLKKYPFHGRLLLFLVPLILLLVADGIEYVRNMTSRRHPVFGNALCGFLLLAFLTGNFFIRPAISEIKPVMKYVQENRRSGDLLYVYYGAFPAFEYYSDVLGIPEGRYIRGVSSRENWSNYAKDLDKVRGHKRVWILLSHIYSRPPTDEEEYYRTHLDAIGKKLDTFRSVGSVVYLYDLAGP